MQACDYIWVDHCDFQDGVDGNFDANNGSDHLSITWCRFRYLIAPWAGGSGGSNDHRNTNLWGGSDSNTKDVWASCAPPSPTAGGTRAATSATRVCAMVRCMW
jgi:pectate lyase